MDRLRKDFFFRCVLLHLGLDVMYLFLIIVFGHASTSSSIYKTDSFFSASAVRGWRGRVVGLYIPCVERMAVERCLCFFVI